MAKIIGYPTIYYVSPYDNKISVITDVKQYQYTMISKVHGKIEIDNRCWFDSFEKAEKKLKEYTEAQEYKKLKDRSSRLINCGLCTKEQLKQINEILKDFPQQFSFEYGTHGASYVFIGFDKTGDYINVHKDEHNVYTTLSYKEFINKAKLKEEKLEYVNKLREEIINKNKEKGVENE